MTNESLASTTKGSSAFSVMQDRNGNSLNINSLDTVTISFVREGKTYSTSMQATASLNELLTKANTIKDAKGNAINAFTAKVKEGSYIGKDIAGDTVATADEKNALTITAAGTGVTKQISGVTISVTNTKGQVQKSANAVLDNFSESIRAQNKSDDNAISLQVGTKANQSIRVGLTDMRAEALGLQASTGQTIQIGTQAQANAAINVLDNAVQKALDQQTTIGSVQSRLSYTSTNLTTASENVQASESTIRDADMAKEMTEYTKNNVLLQAAQSMLAQANQSSSSVLSLLQ
jgi:flagellin